MADQGVNCTCSSRTRAWTAHAEAFALDYALPVRPPASAPREPPVGEFEDWLVMLADHVWNGVRNQHIEDELGSALAERQTAQAITRGIDGRSLGLAGDAAAPR